MGGALAAAEGHVEIDAGGRQVDHHHAGLGIALEMRRVFQAGGGDARRQAERRVVGNGKRLVIVLHPDHRSDRSEDLFLADAHLVGRLGKQRRLQVEAGRVALQEFAAEGEFRAFLFADGDIVGVLVELALVDHRADMRAGLQGIVDNQTLHALAHRLNEAVMDAFSHDHPRRRGAALAGGEEGGVDGSFDGDGKIGIVEHHEGVLAAHLQLVLAIVLDRGERDAFAGPGRAGKGDRLDVGAVEHRLTDDRALAHDQVQDALRQAGAHEDVDDCP
ncbi:hypothetical protein LPJGGPFB_06479 [Ensifer adhaerens]|nr:hypothetical protein [Ensifer adhaerens]